MESQKQIRIFSEHYIKEQTGMSIPVYIARITQNENAKLRLVNVFKETVKIEHAGKEFEILDTTWIFQEI
ncbi:MAG: hypothetical protein V4547_19495 [Bacteroidota bacterium]